MKHTNTKKTKKNIIIFMVLFMVANLLVSPVMMCISALGADSLLDYITSIETKVLNVDVLIANTKSDVGYADDIALVNATEYLEGQFNDVKADFMLELSNLDASISLASLIDSSSSDVLKASFEEYLDLGNASPTLDKDNIEDIKYLVSGVEKVLITKEDIVDLIIDYYLLDDNTSVTDYANNYNTKLSGLVDSYNDFNDQIDAFITKVTNTEVEIFNFEQTEVSNGNVPNMVLDNDNIYDLLATLKNTATELKNNISLEIIDTQITSLNDLDSKLSLFMTSFVDSNKTYLQLELDKEIVNLNAKYETLDNNVKNWFVAKSLSYDYSLVKDNLDVVLIDYLKELIELDKEYQQLLLKLEQYLLRKPSDVDDINNLLVTLNSYYESLNKINILANIDTIVNNSNLTKEPVIDLLYNFLDIDSLSYETAKKIVDAKLAFYTISLKDETNYTWEIIEDKIVLKGLKSSLLVSDLLANIESNATIKVNDDTIVNVNPLLKIQLYDANDNLIISYMTLLQADLDGDGAYSANDLDMMQELVVSDDVDDVIYLLDIDNDNVLSIKDVMCLKEILDQGNNNVLPNATSSSLSLVRKDENDKIIYELVLTSDGVVRGFEFNLGVTNDLVYEMMETDYNILLDDSLSPKKLVGLDDFVSGTIARFIYTKNENELSQTSMIISNIIMALGNNSYEEKQRVINTVSNIVEKQEAAQTTTLSNNTITNTLEEEVVEEEVKDLVEEKDEEEEKPIIEEEFEEEEVIWSNIIKIIIIVLLGAAIIYFINRNEEALEEEKEIKKE